MTDYPVENNFKKTPKTFSDLMRIWFKGILETIAKFLIQIGFHPNIISVIGLVGNFIAAGIIAKGNLFSGGILALLMGLVDVIDGPMARLKGEATKFGAFLDSVIDRYSELAIFFGLSIYFISLQNWQGIVASYLAAMGSILVSYTRARALSLGLDAQIGILTRLERYFVLVPALLLNRPLIGLWIIAVLGNFTALQRIYYVWKQVRSEMTPKK